MRLRFHNVNKPVANRGFGIRGGSDDANNMQGNDSFTAVEATNDPETPDQDASPVTDSPPVTAVSNYMGPKASTPGFLRKTFPQVAWHRIPNWLTYARCIAIPALVFQFYYDTGLNKNLHSSLIFTIASITDYLDGFLARRWDICSPFGAFLDPVADKLMVSTALILASGKYGAVMALPTAIILAREIAVSALREWMASRGLRDSVQVGFQGKVKTALTMVALTVVLAVPDGWSVSKNLTSLASLFKASGWDLTMNIGVLMLYMSALVTVTSGSVYFKAAAPILLGKE
jgi:CDP-diacylglycerol---glycerol-3-phosphate 3-phosphatidyltransferase